MAPKILILFLAMSVLKCHQINARELATEEAEQGPDLVATKVSLVQCWHALKELRSCSTQIIRFFIDGHRGGGLDRDCCSAVEILTRGCLPHLITSLGLTPQEASLLRGFCDAASSSSPAAGPPLATSPAPSPQTI